MGSLSASGGYYISSAADKIFASPGTLTGSIGVGDERQECAGAVCKDRVANAVIKSGEYKDIGSSFRKMTPKEEKFLQGVADDIYEQFIEASPKDESSRLIRSRHSLTDRSIRAKRPRSFGFGRRDWESSARDQGKRPKWWAFPRSPMWRHSNGERRLSQNTS